MLKVSKLADYAVMIVLKFAQNPQGLYSATDLISLTGLNLPTVRKVLKLLSLKGVLLAKRGAEGGYTLASEVSEISVLDIVEAIDGPLAFTECCSAGFISCSVNDCHMGGYWHVINKKVRETLSGFKLLELMNTSSDKLGELNKISDMNQTKKENSKEIMRYDG
ncbi:MULTISPECIES: SUF system Fe-S cluster assembly regulator [Cysteiniphilum]|uniref:SUF system Fe-S cluster assembly regulator n=1 Tax=Cysteiniphilum litorale TaxID=2056700 RepID=A0A8J2Z281_9GAMM|nr:MULTISPECIES: SUF system Fe-S cluster assembly regulator [Cysteiniphilum]GGF88289.1 SUF system Fe-S cluster assembly regulator [Cysteiniphilum litorale]